MSTSLPRRIAAVLAGIGASVGFLALAIPTASATPGDEAIATLKPAHVGSLNPGFSEGGCPSEGWGWHFVLGGNFTDFVSVTATFLVDGQAEVVTAPDLGSNSIVNGKHAYLFTSGPGVLQSATATVVLNDAGVAHGAQIDTEFNLSHVCPGDRAEEDPPPTTVPDETPPTTVPNQGPVTTAPIETTTTETPPTSTVPAEVLGVTEVAPVAAQAAQPAAAELAFTGAETDVLLAIAGGVLLSGGALQFIARRRNVKAR